MPAAGKCLINARDLGLSIKDWAESNLTKSMFKNPYEAAFKLVEAEFLMPIEEIGAREVDITKGQVLSFKARLKELNKNINTGSLFSNKFVESFWQTSHAGKKDPVIASVLRNMQGTDYNFRASTQLSTSLMKSLMDSIHKESVSRGILNEIGVVGSLQVKKAEKRMRELDEQLKQAIVDYENKETIGTDKIEEIQAKIDKYVKKSYLTVYKDLLYVIENDIGRLEVEKFNKLSESDKDKVREGKMVIKLDSMDYKDLKLENGDAINKDMFNAIDSYRTLMGNLYGQLKNGVNARIDSIIERTKFYKGEQSKKTLESIREKLQDKLMPKYGGDSFFPHYTRDLSVSFMEGLMPFFDKMQNASNPYIKSKKGTPLLDDVLSDLNLYISNHVKGRNEKYEYSKNFLNVISGYINDVNRFNYIAYMDKHHIDGLSAVENIYKKDGNAKGYGENIVSYITDMHKAANGDTNISPKTRALMRTVLSFEFISKLGYNPRGATRNLFQRLLDYVQWGPKHMKKTDAILERISGVTSETLESELKKAGLLYGEGSPQLIESDIKEPASAFKQISYNEETNKVEYSKKGRLEKIADKVGWAAGKSGVLHRLAENSNRKRTFKVAFAQMYDWLDSPKYRKMMESKNKNITEKQVQESIRKRARNYAINMTILNHFDYAQYSKSKAVRSNVGRFLLQFQHYSFEFFERNMNIMREAKYDVIAGNYRANENAQGLFKAYNMSKAYFLAPVIASALTGLDFDNLIEHDTSERIKQLAVALTGDEDEIKQAFYGKGPIISTFGGPITSTIIDLGVLFDFINLDEDSILSKISGMEKYDPSNRSDKLSQGLRILNTSIGRTYERHIPQMIGGKGYGKFAPLWMELGIYPTAKARKREKVLKSLSSKIIPSDIQKALDALES